MLAPAHARDPEISTTEIPQGLAVRWTMKVMAFVAAASLAVMVFAATPGLFDVFVSIKEIVFRAEALLALLLLTIAIAFGGGMERLREMVRDRAAAILPGAIVIWTLITSAVSTNHIWSNESVITVIASVLIFLLTWYAAPAIPIAVMYLFCAIAVMTTLLIELQEYHLWQPFNLEWGQHHLGSTGTIGNPNLVGSYLAIVAIALLAAAVVTHRWRRWVFGAGALAAILGVFVSETRTALITVAVTIIFAAVWRSWKYGLIAALIIAVGLIAAVVIKVPVMMRLVEVPQDARAGRWDKVLSERFPPFLSAVEMFRDRPLTGLGPGTFKYHYMRYRTELPRRYPATLATGAAVNFGETHNDHLQVLAETGFIGYALFLGSLVILTLSGRPIRGEPTSQKRLAHALGPPLAVATFVLCLAQFPLQVAVTRHLLLTLAALVVGWRR